MLFRSGDEEAKRRGTQKSILERMSPPTFDIVVEIQEWDKVAIHPDVGEAVDAILRSQPPATETRWLDNTGEVRIEKEEPVTRKTAKIRRPIKGGEPHKLYLFGINRARLEQMANEMQLDINIVNHLNEANLFITSKSYYRRKPQKVRDTEATNLPIYVLKSNTPAQIRQLLHTIYPTNGRDSLKLALSEAEEAVIKVQSGEEAIELSPQSAYIRRLQHLIAERNDVSSRSLGKDPNRRVRIYK